MKAKIAFLCAGLLLAAAPAFAQMPQPAQAPRPPHDPLGENLFPPELVMRHQRKIGLEPEQKSYLRDEMRKAQLRFTELQWQLEDAMEAMRSLLEQTRVAEAQVLVELEKVLEAERAIKRTQLTLMIRIKNKLTPEQQARLRELRPQAVLAPDPVQEALREHRRLLRRGVRTPQPPNPPSPPPPPTPPL